MRVLQPSDLVRIARAWGGTLLFCSAQALAAQGAAGTIATAPPAKAPAAAPSPPAPVYLATDGAVVRHLKIALAESAARLGQLEPWEQRIFDEEALPQYTRFIRNYRSSQQARGGSGLEVDIDMEALKNYLRFYAPKSLGRDEKSATALIYLRPDESCARCVAAAPLIRKLAETRIARRGMTPVWLTPEDLGHGADGTELAGKALDDRVAELAQTRGAAASLVMQWGLAPADDVDTAHADEKHYLLHSLLIARGLAGTAKLGPSSQIVARSEGSADLLEVDSFDASAAKLLSDAFGDLGVQAQQAEATVAAKGGAQGDDGEIDLDVSGVHDFAQYGKLKAQVQAKFSGATVEERKISRGRVVLALVGEKAAPEVVRGQLVGLSLDPAAPASPKLASLDPSGTAPASQGDQPPVISMEIRQ